MNKIAFYLDEVFRLLTGEPIAPVTCEIDVANSCQNECSFCISGDNKSIDMMEMALFHCIIDQLSGLSVKSITFSGGGEPTLHPQFNDMVNYAGKSGFKTGLITNGILLHQIDVEPFEFVRVSLDAGDAEVYKKLKGTDLFGQVIANIQSVRPDCSTLGLSYVINGQPAGDIRNAEYLASNLGVDYIQFKPENGMYFSPPDLKNALSFYTERKKEATELSCIIAGLVGVITSDGRYAFCCQHRYEPEFNIANLKEDSLIDAIKKRSEMQWNVDRSRCVSCRYTAYAQAYTELLDSANAFLTHKEFL